MTQHEVDDRPRNATPLRTLIEQKHIVVCCGTGGVGKTTTAAVLRARGREARAQRGGRHDRPREAPRRHARRRARWATRSQVIDRRRWDPDGRARQDRSPVGGDARHQDDVRRSRRPLRQGRGTGRSASSRTASTATSPARSREPRSTWRWRSCTSCTRTAATTSSSSTRRRRRHALDFLDAPNRLIRLLDNRVFRLLMMPTRAYLRVASVGGADLPAHGSRRSSEPRSSTTSIAFFPAFEGMEQGFRDRAGRRRAAPRRPVDRVRARDRGPARRRRRSRVLRGPIGRERPRRHGAGREPDAARVRDGRSHPGAARARRLVARGRDHGPARRAAARRLAARYDDLADFAAFAARERAQLAGVAARLDTDTVAYVAELTHDVHDFAALAEVARHLFAAAPAPG